MTGRVAAFESCLLCLRGDTDTFLMVHGEAEVAVAFIEVVLGLPRDQATGIVQVWAEDLGCDPGKVPDGEIDFAVRLCEDCAERRSVQVRRAPGPMPVYGPPQEER